MSQRCVLGEQTFLYFCITETVFSKMTTLDTGWFKHIIQLMDIAKTETHQQNWTDKQKYWDNIRKSCASQLNAIFKYIPAYQHWQSKFLWFNCSFKWMVPSRLLHQRVNLHIILTKIKQRVISLHQCTKIWLNSSHIIICARECAYMLENYKRCINTGHICYDWWKITTGNAASIRRRSFQVWNSIVNTRRSWDRLIL